VRLLHVLGTLKPSGAEVGIRDAAGAYDRHGIGVEVVATGPEPGPFAPALEAVGYRVHHLPLEPFPAFARALPRLLRDRRPDVVHLHPERGTFALVLLCRAGGARAIVRSIHNVFAFSGALRAERTAQRALTRALGVRQVSVSRSVTAHELAAFRNPTALVPNGYDDRRFRPPSPAERAAARAAHGLPDGAFAVATVANCSPVKNHAALLEALAALAPDLDVHWLHAGIEEPGAPERALAAACGLDGRARFLGLVDDVPRVLHAADCYAMPSRHEGLGNAALEALGCGLPSVLADVEGLRDLRPLFPGVRWAAPEPAPLAGALRAVAALPAAERDRLGADHAAVAAERFGLDAMIDGYVALYRAAARA